MDSKPSQYPEHDKLEKVQHFTEEFGQFFEWLATYRERRDDGEGYYFSLGMGHDKWWSPGIVPWQGDPMKLVAKFYGIDEQKLEQEKRQMLEAFRAAT